METKALAEKMIQVLEDKKAEDIHLLDLHDRAAFAAYMIIASATSTRQIYALTQYLEEAFKEEKIIPHIEGRTQCEWVLVYGGDVVIHLLLPEARAFYQLEKMWATAFDEHQKHNHKTLV
jgi:ribosome-associated protein